MRKVKGKFKAGVTIIELTISMAICSILMLAAGAMLVGGQRSWQQTYDTANSRINREVQVVMSAFGGIGRKSNRLAYQLYNVEGNRFTPAQPQTADPEEVVFGDAVEFQYWDVELENGDPYDLMDVTKQATAYALFYIDSEKLKVDYGSVDSSGVGAVPEGGGTKHLPQRCEVFAENVTADPNGAFSHTTLNGVGQGCVRINVTLNDPNDDDNNVTVRTATMLRNIWPR